MFRQAVLRPSIGHLLLAQALSVLPLVAQPAAPFANHNVPGECHTKMLGFRAAGETILSVAFPPAGGNSWSVVTDRSFFNRGVPSECHAKMQEFRQAGQQILCVAFVPAGGNRWSVITDQSFFNRGIPAECHAKMQELTAGGREGRVRRVSTGRRKPMECHHGPRLLQPQHSPGVPRSDAGVAAGG